MKPGGMRRTHLRGHENILKRLIVHAAGFNLGLLMRHVIGIGKPRCLQDLPGLILTLILWFCALFQSLAGFMKHAIASAGALRCVPPSKPSDVPEFSINGRSSTVC